MRYLFLFIFCLVLMPVSQVFGQPLAPAPSAKNFTIPLPGQTLWAKKGIQAGMGIGTMERGVCNRLTIWQARSSFFYKPNFSGGASARISGGNIDSKNSGTVNRLNLNTRYHYAEREFGVYFGPKIGLDNTDLKALRDDLRNINDDDADTSARLSSETHCQDVFKGEGIGLGAETGVGWKLTRPVSFTFSLGYEYKLSGPSTFDLTMGLAYDLLTIWPDLMNSTNGLYIYLELFSGVNLEKLTADKAVFVGNALAF